MFLTSLTLQGFKSFAERTVLDVEPGVTVIVGPNGSGKSNIVDALAWVLGTHAPTRIRGGSMVDAIFAGSPTRAAAGRARVEIAIDNSDGQLGTQALGAGGTAQRFAEVRIAREIHSDGESRYLINGQEVRALDVQELLSDTGLGRELHTIVGQGQLDAILNAKPEERRAFIEEAAGILKHRRRRERALRKLEQVDVHIDKLRTILRELRRQLKPLERQAENASRVEHLRTELTDVQTRLAAHDLAVVVGRLAEDAALQRDANARRTTAEAALHAAQAHVEHLEASVSELDPAAERAQTTVHSLRALRERLRGTTDLIHAQRRHFVEYVDEALGGRPPDELRAQAARVDLDREARLADVGDARTALEQASAARRAAEQARRAHEAHVQAESRRRAEQRERVLRWEGEVSALRGSVATAQAEHGRVTAQLVGLDERLDEAGAAVDKVQEEIRRLDVEEVELTAGLEQAEGLVEAAQQEVERLAEQARVLEADRSSQSARSEALRATLAEQSGGSRALAGAGLDGVLGSLADLVRVTGPEPAVAAALGPLGEAVAVATRTQAAAAIGWLRQAGAGGAHVLPAVTDDRLPAPVDAESQSLLDRAQARPVGELIVGSEMEGSDAVAAALRDALSDTWLVADWDEAVRLHGRCPHLTFVTPAGDAAGPRGYVGGQAPERSAVVTATAAEEAERRAADLAAELQRVVTQRARADAVLMTQRASLREATERINESDARITGAAERLARLNKELVALANQREIVSAQRDELGAVLERDRAALSELNSRGPDVDQVSEPTEADPETVRVLEDAIEHARREELDARVAAERSMDRVRHLEQQVADLRRQADDVEAALAAAADRRQRRREAILRCNALISLAEDAMAAIDRSILAAERDQAAVGEKLITARAELTGAREQADADREHLDGLREERHSAELRRAELIHDRDAAAARLRDDLDRDPDEVLQTHPDATSYNRAKLSEREDVLVRRIGLIGRINPLALEEFRALEERHTFLASQLDDLRRSKLDLEQVVTAVDEKIREVFVEAFRDVEEAFQSIFATVFPGGRGRLVLTDPEDMLATGIEVEARPPGKKVTRLSLLSGGERSLTVLAFVFAIFKARPSPFYVLDEVDAALDDINLQRLLRVIESFRGQAQIIMVTHQKRSMESADVLYGVTMGKDAVTTVVAERFADLEIPEPLPA